MLDIVLHTLANNGDLDPKLASEVACVSRFARDEVALLWKRKAVRFKRREWKTLGTRGGCRACMGERASTPFALCKFCAFREMRLVTATVAKTKYLLSEADLKEQLTCMHSTHPTFNKPIRHFDEFEVRELAVLRHGGFGAFARARAKATAPKPASKARIERQARLDLMVSEDPAVGRVLEEDDMDVVGIENFLANGSDGIKALKTRLTRWAGFDAMVSRLTTTDAAVAASLAQSKRLAYTIEDMRRKYVEGQVLTLQAAEDALREEIAAHRLKRERRAALAEALAATKDAPSMGELAQAQTTSYGDVMGDAAKACMAYVSGSRHDLEGVVSLAVEAAFFHRRTAFSMCLKDVVAAYRREVRRTTLTGDIGAMVTASMPTLMERAKRFAARNARAMGVKVPRSVADAYLDPKDGGAE